VAGTAPNEKAWSREQIVDLLRAYQQKVAGWLALKIRPWKGESDFTQSEDYKTALKAYNDFKKADGIDYSPVVTYARELYDRYDKTDKTLDEKADSVIRYLGGGSALITFGALLSLKSDIPESRQLGIVLLLSLIPSLLSTICAVFFAIRVRQPQLAATLPNVDFAQKMAEYYELKNDTELNTYLIFSPICEAAHFRNTRKGVWLKHAHRAYLLSIACLLVPATVIPFYLRYCM
jgi:hypothetical protein